jgi:hypothetical protein
MKTFILTVKYLNLYIHQVETFLLNQKLFIASSRNLLFSLFNHPQFLFVRSTSTLVIIKKYGMENVIIRKNDEELRANVILDPREAQIEPAYHHLLLATLNDVVKKNKVT